MNLDIYGIYMNLDINIWILTYIYESWHIYTNLDIHIWILTYIYKSCHTYMNLAINIWILTYIYESWHIYIKSWHIYIKSWHIYIKSWHTYMVFDTYIWILIHIYQILMFCPFLTSIYEILKDYFRQRLFVSENTSIGRKIPRH